MTVLPLIHFAFKRLSTSLSLCSAGKPTSHFTKIKSSTRRSDIEVLTQSYIARLLKHPVMTVICIVCWNSHHQHNILRIFLTLQSIIIIICQQSLKQSFPSGIEIFKAVCTSRKLSKKSQPIQCRNSLELMIPSRSIPLYKQI